MDDVQPMNKMNESSSSYDNSDDSTPLLYEGNVRESVNSPNNSSVKELPPDKYHYVYITFLLMGTAALLPYNMFINATGYFDYKLRNISYPNSTIETSLQRNFESYFTTFSTTSLLLMIFGNTLLVRYMGPTVRLGGAMVLVIISFTPTLILVKINTDSWQNTFFIATLIDIILINVFSAILQGGTMGVASMLPPLYTQAAMAGQAVAGVFASLLNIFCIAVFEDQESSGLLYFILAQVFLVVTLISMLGLRHNHFYVCATTNFNASIATPSERFVKGSMFGETLLVFRKTLPCGFAVAFVFLVTLMVFPNYIDSIKTERSADDGKYWAPITCFLLYNSGDLFGRVMAGVIKKPSSAVVLVILSLSRVAFLVLFLFCDYQPRSHDVPVYITGDYWPVLFNGLLAISNGYIGSLCMMFGANKLIRPDLQEQAGTVLAFFLSVGLSLGSSLSFLYINIP